MNWKNIFQTSIGQGCTVSQELRSQVHFDNIVKKGIEFKKLLDKERGMSYISGNFQKIQSPKRFEFTELTDEEIQTRLRDNMMRSDKGKFKF